MLNLYQATGSSTCLFSLINYYLLGKFSLQTERVLQMQAQARGPLKRGAQGDRPSCHPQKPPLLGFLLFVASLTLTWNP